MKQQAIFGEVMACEAHLRSTRVSNITACADVPVQTLGTRRIAPG